MSGFASWNTTNPEVGSSTTAVRVAEEQGRLTALQGIRLGVIEDD